jgi:hypothetical protein
MATNPPSTPILTYDQNSRTLTSVVLHFAPGSDNGGSSITGYQLWQNEGIMGSPSAIIYYGSGRPEILTLKVDSLITSLTYTFNLYSINQIFNSSTSASLTI